MEPKLDLGVDLVDVLPPRSGGSDEGNFNSVNWHSYTFGHVPAVGTGRKVASWFPHWSRRRYVRLVGPRWLKVVFAGF